MLRIFKLGTPVIALVALAMFASHAVRAADDTSTTQPSASGSIVVTVLDSGGSPVAKARVQLFAKPKAADSDDAGAPAKPKAIARGATDEDGKYTFSNVASGDYRVVAMVRKNKTRGNASVTVSDDSPNATVSITLSAPAGDNGGATTEPAK